MLHSKRFSEVILTGALYCAIPIYLQSGIFVTFTLLGVQGTRTYRQDGTYFVQMAKVRSLYDFKLHQFYFKDHKHVSMPSLVEQNDYAARCLFQDSYTHFYEEPSSRPSF